MAPTIKEEAEVTTEEAEAVPTEAISEVAEVATTPITTVVKDQAINQSHAPLASSADTFIRCKDAETFTVKMRHKVLSKYLQIRSSISRGR